MSIHARLPADVQVLERGWLSSNNVLLIGSEQAALVDSGYCTHSAQTLALVGQALGHRSLDLLVNTHLHSDHCGGNAALQARYPSLRTLVPPGEAEAVRVWDEDKLSYRATGQECPRFRINGTLEPGTTVSLGDASWEVHAAPGHDPHAVLLYRPDAGLLISGDALWEKGFGIVFPEMWGEPSFDEVAATLDLIESLKPDCVIPGHGAVFEQVDAALATARERLDAFVRSPQKHARHAIKVLIKFKLLEMKKVCAEDFQTWLSGAAYLREVHQRFAADRDLQEWSGELLNELVRSGAARREGDLLFDAP
ncbi:MBL fold metallo-hydrolase [Variovorax sp. OV329]|uniref:MBL fold metallo-hydrolase n=1 Tax=Variovorax sp. OV329 TaxID=1882825 RepID=UPI000B804630|nr:MBL fold metallo-hydrolase [Variovorax sp. OV329]